MSPRRRLPGSLDPDDFGFGGEEDPFEDEEDEDYPFTDEEDDEDDLDDWGEDDDEDFYEGDPLLDDED